MVRRFNKTVLGTLLLVAVSASHLYADLLLAVDFDINQAGIQDTAIVDSNGKTTAWIVLYLSNDSDLYSYGFSVRYNSNRLILDSKDDTPPSNVNGKIFDEVLTEDRSVSGSGGGFANYTEINRFDGKIRDKTDTLVITAPEISGGLVLAELKFTVIGTGDDLLIMPGLFEPPDQVFIFDGFLGNISNVTFQPGNISAVPEPSSLLLVAAGGLVWAGRKRISANWKRSRESVKD